MRGKKLLAAFLLGMDLCFVPVVGYGKVSIDLYKGKVDQIDFRLLNARVSYMMRNPTNFLNIIFSYDSLGLHGFMDFEKLPAKIDTKGKIFIYVGDNRDRFSAKSGVALLDQFKAELEPIYSFIQVVATDMDTDIVAKFASRNEIPLGYFYQGEYHLWEE